MKMRPIGAYSFFMHSIQACARASTECIGGRMRLFLCMDAVSAIYGAQRQEVPHNVLTNIPQPKAVREADALAGVRREGAER